MVSVMHQLLGFIALLLGGVLVHATPSAPSSPSYVVQNVAWSNCNGSDWPLSTVGWSATMFDGDIITLTFHMHTSVLINSAFGQDNGTFNGVTVSRLVGLDQILLPPYAYPLIAGSSFVLSQSVQWQNGPGHWDGHARLFDERGIVFGCLDTAYDVVVSNSSALDIDEKTMDRHHRHPSLPLGSNLSAGNAAQAQYQVTDVQWLTCPGDHPLTMTKFSAYVSGGDVWVLIYRFVSTVAISSGMKLDYLEVPEHKWGFHHAFVLNKHMIAPANYPIAPKTEVILVEQVPINARLLGVVNGEAHVLDGAANAISCFNFTFKTGAM